VKINKKSMVESLSDTTIGLCLNFPIGLITLIIMTKFTYNPLYISGMQTLVLTGVAITRRYLTREWFRSYDSRG
jgi:hypothetical protein